MRNFNTSLGAGECLFYNIIEQVMVGERREHGGSTGSEKCSFECYSDIIAWLKKREGVEMRNGGG